MDNTKSLPWVLSNAFWALFTHICPTKLYLTLRYRLNFGKWVDWSHPLAFTEKLQWMKVYGYRPEYTAMVDKVLVKQYVESKIGRDYIVPTLTAAKSTDDIDFETLPSRFVLKTNHDSGTAIICSNKNDISIDKAKKLLNKALKKNYYLVGRETPYKYVDRMVFAEAYIDHNGELVDYKFFCFNGEPKLFKIDYDRSSHHHSNYYNLDMELLPFHKESERPDTPRIFNKPINFNKMLDIVRVLSKDIPFVRVDLYNIEGRIYFGELTFFPSSGFEPLSDPEWDLKLGSWLELPKSK